MTITNDSNEPTRVELVLSSQLFNDDRDEAFSLTLDGGEAVLVVSWQPNTTSHPGTFLSRTAEGGALFAENLAEKLGVSISTMMIDWIGSNHATINWREGDHALVDLLTRRGWVLLPHWFERLGSVHIRRDALALTFTAFSGPSPSTSTAFRETGPTSRCLDCPNRLAFHARRCVPDSIELASLDSTGSMSRSTKLLELCGETRQTLPTRSVSSRSNDPWPTSSLLRAPERKPTSMKKPSCN